MKILQVLPKASIAHGTFVDCLPLTVKIDKNSTKSRLVMNPNNYDFRLKSVLKLGWIFVLVANLSLSRVSVAQPNYSLAYTFTTLAGKSATGNADGVGDAAQFKKPAGITADSMGNLYVADTYNDTIRKITSAGVVSTLAGFAGSSGSSDGTSSSARFNLPYGIAVDSSNNLYVADTYNDTIRKITPAGVVSTFAGLAGNIGSQDGTNSNARFYYPMGIAVDSSNNLYVADTYNDTIRKITPAGVVSTLTGLAGNSGSSDGTNSNALFYLPSGVAVDSANNLYVADTYNDTIRKIAPAGVVSTPAGLAGISGGQDGTSGNARFYQPFGIIIGSEGYIYVVDTGNCTIRIITTAGVVSTLAGLTGGRGSADGTGSNARFYQPFGIAIDNSANLYVADTFNHTIRKITTAGVVSTIAGLADSGGSFDGTGSNARFYYPMGIAVDSSNNLYVADTYNDTIRKITPAGVVSTLAGFAGSSGSSDGTGSSARFNLPYGIAVDSSNNLYVADTYNDTIREITPAGVVSTLTGLAGNSGSSDGTNSNARFYLPSGVAVDSVGNLYVTDDGNNTIRKILRFGTNWVVSTLAGLAGNSGYADGTGANARFYFPLGISVDRADNLYVTDEGNDTIRDINTAEDVSTLAGSAGDSGSDDGTGSKAQFGGPGGIVVDSLGNLYVADIYNNTIRKGTFTAYGPANEITYTEPPMNGQLVVTLLPPEAEGQWRFPWESGWHNSGDVVSNLIGGKNYPISFRSLSGYLTVSNDFQIAVTGGATTYVTNEYYPTLSVAGTTNAGSLTVNIQPNAPSGSGWRFLGETAWRTPGATASNLPSDVYFIEFEPVSGYSQPSSQAIEVYPTLPTVFTANYLLAQSPPSGVLLPEPVPVTNINDMADYPFGFNGQLQTDVGYGSGVAVQPNVVLTAAHLVFNDETLSYVNQAWWYFQQEAGTFQPKPLQARGWYVLSGYAAQRTNDLQSGFYVPNQSSPQSRNFDVAALYFLSPVAGGGFSGYLPSDASPNTWLTSTALKMLVGYPVDGSLFGDASIVPGVMYQTDPQPYPLSLATDPVDDQQVYFATWFLSYPGNSGGPFYVNYDGYYYPAGVYLGTLYNGIVPYASLVRGIDSNVVDMITLAATLGDSGTNNTGGGVITVIPNQSVIHNPGYLQLQLGPAAAVAAGAAWRLQGQPSYSTAPNYTVAVNTTNVIVVEYKPIAGWNLSTNQTLTVLPGQFTDYSAAYTVINPMMVANPALGIGITGTTGTVYEIESRSSLTSGTWIPISTNTIQSNGFNFILPLPGPTNQTSIFYRAVWLP